MARVKTAGAGGVSGGMGHPDLPRAGQRERKERQLPHPRHGTEAGYGRLHGTRQLRDIGTGLVGDQG